MKYASQIFGDALALPLKASSKKLSSLEPGQIVRFVDGSAYRVSSKTASPKGIAYKLADLSGKPVPTPADFRPVGLAMARFASWLRYHLAYNKDFDLYVNSYIEKYNSEHPDTQLPYPVGPDGKPFRWAKWFQSTIIPKLYVNIGKQPHGHDSQAQAMKDEVIHEMLFTVLGQRHAIDKFAEKIKRFGSAQKLEVARQLTVYLTSIFSHKHRLMEMQGLLKEQQPDQEMSMWQPGMGEEGEGTEQNILDTEEHGVGAADFESAEAQKDIAKFRDGFGHWLKSRSSDKVANSFLTLFDIYWDLISQSGSDDVQDVEKSDKQKKKEERKSWMLSRADLMPLWAERTGLSEGSMKDYLGRLPGLMEEYITSHQKELGASNIFVSLMKEIKNENKKSRPAKASSLKVAEEEDIQKQMDAEYAIHGKSEKWFKLRDQSHNREPQKVATGVEGDFSQALRNSENPDVVDQDIKQPTESVSEAAGVKQGGKTADEYEDHVRRSDPQASPNAQADVSPEDASTMLAGIRPGDRVTIMRPAGMGRGGQEWAQATGRAVMRSSHGGWVLNMGGKHGTPGLVDERNIVSVRKGKQGSAKTAKLIAGADLTPEMRKQVEQAFMYRWTHENQRRKDVYQCSKCDVAGDPYVNEKSSEGHTHPTIPLISDEQWIREHAFHFTNDGRLATRGDQRHAEPAYLAQHNARRVASVDQKFAVEKAAYNPGQLAYMYKAALYCQHCGEEIKKHLSTSGNVPQNLDETQYDSDSYPKGPYPDGGGEADSPQHCDKCGRFLENPLTQEGIEYVRRAVDDYDPSGGGSAPVIQEWMDFYSDVLGGAEDDGIHTSAETGQLACCGGWHNRHKPNCSVYDENFNKTVETLQGMKRGGGDYSEPVDMTDEHAISQAEYKPPLDALNLWLEKDAPAVHISIHDQPQTFCGMTIGYHESHTQDANRMIPTSVPEIEETMREDIWCPYCLDEYEGDSGISEPEHVGRVEKEAMIGHMFNDADGQAIRNETYPDTGDVSGESDTTEFRQPRMAAGSNSGKDDSRGAGDNWREEFYESREIGPTADALGLTKSADTSTTTMQTQNATFPTSTSQGEPMAVPDAIDQAPGPHSPNAPATAPRTPDIQPRIVDVPSGTVDGDFSNTASEDADWESMHPEEQDDEDAEYDCPKCNSGNTEIDAIEDGGYAVYCNDCEQVTETHPGEAQPQGFTWHGPTPEEARAGDFSDEENEKFKTFMKSLGASKKEAKSDEELMEEAEITLRKQGGEETYEVFVRDFWRVERGKRVPNPGADEEQLATGLSYSEARDMCEEWNSSHDPGEVSRKAEFRGEGNATDDDEEPSAYTIYGTYKGNTEEIDTAEDLQSAEYLVGEYKLAYGKDWTIWYEDAQGNKGDMPAAPGKRDLDMMQSMGIRGSQKTAIVAPAIPTQTISPNVVQNQNIARPQLPAGQPGSSVAIMPGQEQEEGGISRHTVEPELPNANYHMQGAQIELIAAEEERLAKEKGVWDAFDDY